MNKPPEKRKPRSYKITDTDYNRAMKKAKKDKANVAGLVEGWLKAYGEGYVVGIVEQAP